MSEMINNREYRQEILKELILEIHQGKPVEEVKPRFEELIQGVSAKEISEMEQALMMDGMPLEQIQNLCDVHAAVFKGSIEEIHRPEKEEEIPGHPIHTLKAENRKLEKLIKDRLKPHAEGLLSSRKDEDGLVLLEDLELLLQIDKHYSRKENLFFPFMEKYGITAPPKVMWGVDDEIRAAIKEAKRLCSDAAGDKTAAAAKAIETGDRVIEMIFKEENILVPMILETLTEDEWLQIAEASDEIGYTLMAPKGKWTPLKKDADAMPAEGGGGTTHSMENNVGNKPMGGVDANGGEVVRFDAGFMSPEEINAMLNTLPVDITFVDKDGLVKYFTQGKERIFARPKTIIGREVKNCHPPASVHIVEKIVEDLRSGVKDHEDFWIKMGDKYVQIRYFAVRNEKGEYLGTMEFTQDIGPIQVITGEKRLISE